MDNDTGAPVTPNSQPSQSTAKRSQRRARTRPRVSAACVRCQKRKIKCDGILPSCSPCQRSGADCVDGGTSRDASRTHVAELEARVLWLESVVRQNCPDVDLTGGHVDPPEDRQSTAATASRQAPAQVSRGIQEITEEIQLVSLATGGDVRYLGPSSGSFFTKFVLAGLSRRAKIDSKSLRGAASQNHDRNLMPAGLVQIQAEGLPSDQSHTKWLSQVYFDTVHAQYPFLHQPSHMATVSKLYSEGNVDRLEEFQVFLVLAIGATIVARRAKVRLSAEGFYASAMQHLEAVFQQSSLASIHCMLLLQMYSMNNPSSGLSLWTLHYHSLSLVLELGLHRDVGSSRHFTFFEREMRRRAFWCVYSIDRLLSTMMGRSIALVDEAYDIDLPMSINDSDLGAAEFCPASNTAQSQLSNLSSAIHLFKLARLTSEMKCVLYCVDRNHPPYTQPMITDVDSWRVDILSRLRKWKQEISQYPEGHAHHFMTAFCEIRYHEVVMLILRPSPLFTVPKRDAIHQCFKSAISCINLYEKLYTADSLTYGWVDVHSLYLCTITLFYCVWTPDGVADQVDFSRVTSALKSASDILSAIGEHWPGAKRSRDILDRVFTATVRRFTHQDKEVPPQLPATPPATEPRVGSTIDSSGLLAGMAVSESHPTEDISADELFDIFPPYPATSLDPFLSMDWLPNFLDGYGSTDWGGIGGYNVEGH